MDVVLPYCYLQNWILVREILEKKSSDDAENMASGS